MASPREKALDYLISHAQHGQRTRDLYLKRAFLDLEIELRDMRARSATSNGAHQTAANFSERDEDPGTAPTPTGGR